MTISAVQRPAEADTATGTPRRILIVGGGYVGMYTALGLQKSLKRELRAGTIEITVVEPQSSMTYQPFLPEAAAGNVEPRHVVVPLRTVLRRCRVISGAVVRIDHKHRRVTIAPNGANEYQRSYDILVVAPGSVSRVLPIPGLAEHGIGFKTIGEAIELRNHVLSRLDLAASLAQAVGNSITTRNANTDASVNIAASEKPAASENPDADGAAGESAAGESATDTPGDMPGNTPENTPEDTANDAARRRALTFVFVGAGYAGIEALAELENLAQYATRFTEGVTRDDMRWLMVEASDRVMSEVSPAMARYTVKQLSRRGIDVRVNTRLNSVIDGHVVLSDGTEFDTDTVVWTAGVKPNPMLAQTDLPRDDKGRLPCAATLAVTGAEDVFAAGDCAAVPDVTKDDPDATCGPSAQHAVRQAKLLARNIVASLNGQPLREYRHAYAGSVASLGLYHGVAEIYGIRLRGFAAWWMHRTYHVSKMPTFNRKMRIIADWTGGLLFKREVVSLGQLQHPRSEFEYAARD